MRLFGLLLALFALCSFLPTTSSAQMIWTCVTDSAPWEARFGHQLVVFHDTMWLFGGTGSGRRSLNDIWYSTDGDSWICATPLAQWSPRSSPRPFVFDDKLWLTGGFFWNGRYWDGLDDVWWTSDGVNWTLATDSAGWAPRGMHTAVVFHDTMWVIGGCNNTSTGPFYNDVWKSADGDSWVCVTDSAPWTPRGGHTSVVLRDTVWLICGLVYPNSSEEIWRSGDGSNWTLGGLAPWGPRYGHNSVVLRDTVWSMAGYDMGTGRYFNDVWYSADGSMWLLAVDSAEWGKRHFPASTVFDNALWIAGGTYNYWNGLGDVWTSSGLTGMEERPTSGALCVTPSATIVRGVLVLGAVGSRQNTGYRAELLDISGREVMDLRPGANDVRALAPGVYFVRPTPGVGRGTSSGVIKVVVAN